MKELPILFSGTMVRALLEGRKTQTRRVMENQPTEIPQVGTFQVGKGARYSKNLPQKIVATWGDQCCVFRYGSPGDRLWVRETYAIVGIEGRKVSIARAERMPPGKTLGDTDGGLEILEVDPETAAWAAKRVDCERWKPAIFMPRWACRLVLEVIAVRVERLQDISEADTLAEGFVVRPDISSDPEVHRDAARDWYMELWDSLNAARGYGWKENPWVWIVAFKRAS